MKFIQLLMVSILVTCLVSCQQEKVDPNNSQQPTIDTQSKISNRAATLSLTYSLTDDYKVSIRVVQPSGLPHRFYRWRLGDGSVIRTTEPRIVYQYPCTRKSYNVRVTEEHYIGSTDATGNITVLAKPDGGSRSPLTLSSTKVGSSRLDRIFTASGGEGCFGNKFYHWDFDDGFTRTTTTNTINYKYRSPDDYRVKVEIRDGAGILLSGPAQLNLYLLPF